MARLGEVFTLCERGKYGGDSGVAGSSEELVHKTLEIIKALDREV
jgi:hypothetical protein